jgi:hypothetical protein
MTPFTVRLTFSEIALAHQVAGQRMILAMKNALVGKYGAVNDVSNDRANLDILGCLGESAVAKACNYYWSPQVGEVGQVDVGGKVEVRSVSKAHYRLILTKDDNDELPYVLADVSETPFIRIRGWIMGRDGKHEKYWQDPGNGRWSYFIPQADLHPFSKLLEQMAGVSA